MTEVTLYNACSKQDKAGHANACTPYARSTNYVLVAVSRRVQAETRLISCEIAFCRQPTQSIAEQSAPSMTEVRLVEAQPK